MEGCSPWGRYELVATEQLLFHFSLSCIGEGNGNPLQCSCLENPGDGGAWWAAVYGVTQSQTWLKRLSSSSSSKTLCDPMDWSLPGFSVHGILQARILEWVAMPFSRGSFLPRDWTWISCIAGRFFTVWATREAHKGRVWLDFSSKLLVNYTNSQIILLFLTHIL